MFGKARKHTISFKNAFEGLIHCFRSQPNFRVHVIIALAVLIIALMLGLSQPEWLVLIFAIFLVFVAEMVNTAIESMTDLITIRFSQRAKIAKDVSAAMVLVAAAGAVIIGFVIFLPYLL